MTGPAEASAFLPPGAPVPEGTRTPRLRLRPLCAADAELDYDAVMESAAMLRRWSGTSWPPDDFTLAENRADLERHEREHRERVAFTYTVLAPDGARCLGCVYLQPLPGEIAARTRAAHGAAVAFWVRASELPNGLEDHLLETLERWLAAAWAFDRVVYTLSPADSRQAVLLRAAGLQPVGEFAKPDGRRALAFGRPGAGDPSRPSQGS